MDVPREAGPVGALRISIIDGHAMSRFLGLHHDTWDRIGGALVAIGGGIFVAAIVVGFAAGFRLLVALMQERWP